MCIRKIMFGLCCLAAVSLASTAGSFLENPISARSIVMGNTGLIKSLEGQQNYQIMQSSTSLLDLSLFFSFLNNGIEGIPNATYDSNTGTAEYNGNTFGYTGRAYVFTAGQRSFLDFYWGANLKFIQESFYTQPGSNAGLDAGLFWQKPSRQIGLSVINAVPPQLTWTEGWTETPETKALPEFAYKILQNWTAYTDIEKSGERPVYYGLGTEVSLFNTVALRGGWNPDQFSAGAGIYWNGFNINYAYVINSDNVINNSHFISLAYIFGIIP